MIPDSAAGRTTRREVSSLVAPTAQEASRRDTGTACRASSDMELTSGMMRIPTTIPAEAVFEDLDDAHAENRSEQRGS